MRTTAHTRSVRGSPVSHLGTTQAQKQLPCLGPESVNYVPASFTRIMTSLIRRRLKLLNPMLFPLLEHQFEIIPCDVLREDLYDLILHGLRPCLIPGLLKHLVAVASLSKRKPDPILDRVHVRG